MAKKYLTDVALLSVTTVEFQAVMHFHDWRAKVVLGDSQKSDEHQRFAAYSSCEFAKSLYEKILPMS